jgi:predicted NBD/HSP70 family sugar kinase
MVGSTPAFLRHNNQRRIIELVLRLHRASRAEISRATGISSPTVGRIVDDLLTAGVLLEPAAATTATAKQRRNGAAGEGPAIALGRPSAALELDNRNHRFLAVQIGVRQTRLTRAPFALPAEDTWESSVVTPTSAKAWTTQLARNIARLPVVDLQAVVVSVPGVVDESTGRALLSPNLKWIESINLKEFFDGILEPPAKVVFVQEIRALALGHLSNRPACRDFLLIDIGTGVGGAAVVRGELFAGGLPLSGELGHTPVLGNTRRCGCGSTGCGETLFSRRGLMQSALEHEQISTWPALVEYVEQHGIPGWMKRTLDSAAVSIAASLNVLGLRQAVLTGCIGELPVAVLQYLRDAVIADAMWARFGSVEVEIAPRRRLAGMVHNAISRTILEPEAR